MISVPPPSTSGLRKPETVWRLVEKMCVQLADAASGARTAFLLALSWTFIWAAALYVYDFGYIHLLSKQIQADSTILGDPTSDAFRDRCCEWLSLDSYQCGGLTLGQRNACATEMSDFHKWVRVKRSDSYMVQLPGGFQPMTVSDLGVFGTAGLILILIWLFYAVRRENHAFRSFVDIDGGSPRKLYLSPPSTYTLVPDGHGLSAEHLAYAYHAISQRFVFIQSNRSRPLVGLTAVLLLLPATVAALHLFGDVLDLYEMASATPLDAGPLYVRVALELGLTFTAAFLTSQIILYAEDSSVLLNGWSLAVRHVWMSEWDETNDDPAHSVRIDTDAGTARAATRHPHPPNQQPNT